MKKEDNILNFDWPNEETYDQWKPEHAMALERIQMATQDKEINQVEGEELQVEEEQAQEDQGQFVDVQMAPQVAKSIEEKDKDTVVVPKEKE